MGCVKSKIIVNYFPLVIATTLILTLTAKYIQKIVLFRAWTTLYTLYKKVLVFFLYVLYKLKIKVHSAAIVSHGLRLHTITSWYHN